MASENENESIKSILAEMIERADAMQTHGTTHGVRLAILEFARRIGAAWKREQAFNALVKEANERLREHLDIALKANKVGNAAATREALELCVEAMCSYCRSEVRVCDLTQCLDGCKTLKIAKSALSEPARNCDRFNNWYDAHQAWEHLPKDELGYFVDANGVHECEQAWLFAPATEQKGEGDDN